MPQVHFWTALIGLLIFMPALAAELLGGPAWASFAHIGLIAGPTLTLLSMIVFAVIVFCATGRRAATA